MSSTNELLSLLEFKGTPVEYTDTSMPKITMDNILYDRQPLNSPQVQQTLSMSPNLNQVTPATEAVSPEIKKPKQTASVTTSTIITDQFNLSEIFTESFLSKLSVEDLDKPLKELILSQVLPQQSAQPVLDWQYYEEERDYMTTVEFSSKEELLSFLPQVYPLTDFIYKVNELSAEVYIHNPETKPTEAINSINNIYSNCIKKKI